MPTLHMEVEVARQTRSNMMTQHQQLTSSLQAITTAVQNTVGSAWQGQSAMEFQQQYDQLRQSIMNQLEQLNQLASNLENEINQWEQMASRMG